MEITKKFKLDQEYDSINDCEFWYLKTKYKHINFLRLILSDLEFAVYAHRFPNGGGAPLTRKETAQLLHRPIKSIGNAEDRIIRKIDKAIERGHWRGEHERPYFGNSRTKVRGIY